LKGREGIPRSNDAHLGRRVKELQTLSSQKKETQLPNFYEKVFGDPSKKNREIREVGGSTGQEEEKHNSTK